MGEAVVVGYGVVVVLGIALVAIGAIGRYRLVSLFGVGLLASSAGAWIFGPVGLGLGVLVVVLPVCLRGRGSG